VVTPKYIGRFNAGGLTSYSKLVHFMWGSGKQCERVWRYMYMIFLLQI
jgi:hypothetical protein